MIENYLITNMSYFLAKGNPEKKLKWAFKMYDIDSNGSVDRQEMLKIIEVKLNSLNTKKIIFFSLQSIYDLLGAGISKNASNGAITGRDPNDTPENRTAQIFAVMVRFIKIYKNNNKSFFLNRMKIKMGKNDIKQIVFFFYMNIFLQSHYRRRIYSRLYG